MIPDYSLVTESQGQKATKEQLERLFHRYHYAKQFVNNKEILEVACGSGLGLGYLAESAAKVTGGDIDLKNLELAKRYYDLREKVNIDMIDAHSLPYDDDTYDVVILYEAIYYLKNPGLFIREARRVLRPGGKLIVCTVNKDWEDFHPSIYSNIYYSVPELYGLLFDEFDQVDLYGAFKVDKGGAKSRMISMLKKLGSKAGLIPGSLKARAFLKRLFFGKLHPIPEEISDESDEYQEPISLDHEIPTKEFKIVYAVAELTR